MQLLPWLPMGSVVPSAVELSPNISPLNAVTRTLFVCVCVWGCMWCVCVHVGVYVVCVCARVGVYVVCVWDNVRGKQLLNTCTLYM